MKYTLSSNGIDAFMNDFFMEAWKQSGSEAKAIGACSALSRHVSTGRATTDFIKSMLRSKPAKIAEISLNGGSDDDTMKRIKSYLKRYYQLEV